MLVHKKVRASESASAAFAVNVKVPAAFNVLPVAAGVCEEQVGAEFFVTVHVFVTVLTLFESVATRVFAPVFNWEEVKDNKDVVSDNVVPLSFH